MAKEVLTDCRIEMDGNDLSNYFNQAEISGDTDQFDSTGFGDTHKTNILGFKSWSVSLTFMDEFDDNGLNELMFDWWGAVVPIKIRKSSGAISAANPEFQGNVVFRQSAIFNANISEIAGGQMEMQGSGTLTRATS